MFMFTSTHEREVKKLKTDLEYLEVKVSWELSSLKNRYRILLKDWNDLVARVNKAGGEKLFEQKPSTQFTDQELKKLIQLCHPDKHKNSTLSIEITQKLNNMRK